MRYKSPKKNPVLMKRWVSGYGLKERRFLDLGIHGWGGERGKGAVEEEFGNRGEWMECVLGKENSRLIGMEKTLKKDAAREV